MPTLYGRSPWVDQFPKSRIPAYPKPKTVPSVDVAIIGGGLTGCATAYAFAAAGIKVALFEADQIGRGSSGSATGWIADEPGARFADVEKLIGLTAARHAWQAWRRAALDFSTLIKRLDIKCQHGPAGTLTAALTAEQAAALKREHKVRKDAGLDASLIAATALAREAGVDGVAAMRSRDGALGLQVHLGDRLQLAVALVQPPEAVAGDGLVFGKGGDKALAQGGRLGASGQVD